MAEVPGSVPGGVRGVGVDNGVESSHSGSVRSGGVGSAPSSGSIVSGNTLAILLCRSELFPTAKRRTDSTQFGNRRASGVATSSVATQLGKGGLTRDHVRKPVSRIALGAGHRANITSVGRPRRRRRRDAVDRRRRALGRPILPKSQSPAALGLSGFNSQTGKLGHQAADVAISLAPLFAACLCTIFLAVFSWWLNDRRRWRSKAKLMGSSASDDLVVA